MPLLSTADLSQIKGDIRNIIHDTSINVPIKYRQFTGISGGYNPTLQQYSKPYTDWSGVSAVKGLVTRDDVQKTGGGVEIGDTKFVFMQSDVSNALHPQSDLVVESGVTYNLKKITLDPLGVVYVAYGGAV